MDPVASRRDPRMRVEALMVRCIFCQCFFLLRSKNGIAHSHQIHHCPYFVIMTAVSKSGDTRIGLVGFPSVGSK